MAYLWQLSTSHEWTAIDLAGGSLRLRGSAPGRGDHAGADDRASSVVLRRASDRGRDVWLLLVGRTERVRVNGLSVVLGITALDDRDEIRIRDEAPLFFTTERLAAIERYPSDGPRAMCPRCKQPIEGLVVRCPSCDLWYHQSEDLPCWTHVPHCACSQPTPLDTGFRWTPEAL